MNTLTARKLLREKDLKARDGMSRVQRWRNIRAGKHPAPVQLGPNSIGWFEDEYPTRPRLRRGRAMLALTRTSLPA